MFPILFRLAPFELLTYKELSEEFEAARILELAGETASRIQLYFMLKLLNLLQVLPLLVVLYISLLPQ